ncbi:hypothetical protein ABL78_3048 [Leptomonas seymouri]|uniref:PBZ-type domain-containing protein n=1 Tax=Leptomonas seymouri TaxID=5684 RepID=A0A0N1PE26_LEPSE|nr:hypothetical protein ABL78_3048 [Leptomonas seymouri]|eukprot:KPI87891.1 hypothetical protein ABL78_3048 [Leptomonas seymouri]
MDTLPPDHLPVCAYDGHCYRKNPQHFLKYSHPLQYPPQQAGSASTEGNEKWHPELPKRCRSEDRSSATAHGSHNEAASGGGLLVQEADLASPVQLLHFLIHAPHLSALIPLNNNSDSGATSLPHIDVQHHWNGVAQVLVQAYGGMGFHAEDVQCVLTAACALKPSDPLSAFAGWRLVGPFELAVRYGELCCRGADTAADASAIAGELRTLLHGRDAEDEACRWRCGRFRYDPPECQTVAVAATLSSTTAMKHALASHRDDDGVHLCFHRDDPSNAPGLLVEGMMRSAKFTMLNGKGWLSPYLYAWYRAKGNADALAVAKALGDALDALSRATKSVHCAHLKRSFEDSLSTQRRDSLKRRKTWVAPTYSGLGLCVPVDKTTEIGYREPNIPPGLSFANSLRDWEADFVASVASSASSDDRTKDHNAGPAGALASQPLSRSSSYARLHEARPFSLKTSDALDNIFLCADIANDEGDFGASLELGLNCFTCLLADTCVVAGKKEGPKGSSDEHEDARGGDGTPCECKASCSEESRIDPVLWQTYRLLDCAYMLLQRPLYRHILRCHLPVLADAEHPILLDMYE